jgi:cytochrome c-type biogenesis protein CcmH/NrfG
MAMTPEAIDVIVRLFKAAIFVPIIGLVTWWILSNWLVEQTLNAEEALIGLLFVVVAFFLGVGSIVAGGWGFLGILAMVYVGLLGVLAWQYIYWRRREHEHWLSEVEKYRAAIDRDPRNAAAYSFLGEACLRLSRFEEAQAALEVALELDPESKRDHRLLRLARERRTQYPWMRSD